MVTESTLRQATTSRACLAARAIRAILASALLVLLPGSPAARADNPAHPPLGIFIYAISRDGAPVGQQRMEFVGDGEKLRIISHTQLDVTLLGMSLYGFDQQVEELRAGPRIMSLTSEADDDGKDKKVSLTLQGDRLKGDYNGTAREIDPTLSTSLFWQKPTPATKQVIDCVRGKVRDITVTDLGAETLALPVGKVETRHIRMTGEMKRDLWYDADGILVAGQLKGPDGSVVRQELQQRP